MSSQNVFGDPVTEGDRTTRATNAYKAMNDGRNLKAKEYVDDQKKKFGDGISALSLIYNATGNSIIVFNNYDWHGRIFDSYPMIIRNGQWGAFLHTKTPGAIAGSEAAVVYRAKSESNEDCDVLIAHGIPYIGSNHAYTSIGKPGQFTNWDDLQNKLEGSGVVSSETSKGITSVASIDDGTSPYFRTTLAFEQAVKLARAV